MSLYSHNPIFHCIFHTTTSSIPPPPNAFVKRFLLLLIKYFIAIYLDFCYLKRIDIEYVTTLKTEQKK